MTQQQALEEIDAVQAQLAWSAKHPHVARPETIGLLYDRLEVAQAELSRTQGAGEVHPVEAIRRLQ